jgi:outer membrane biosynthesis protein TonB
MTRKEISPALMGSVLLHVTVAVMFLISWSFARDLKVGTVVPVNIVSSAPSTDVRPAVAAPEEQTAQADQPVPDAPLESTAPEPQPAPTPPTPAPKAAKPVEKLPAVKPAPPAKPEKGLDLDALSASVSKLVKPAKTAKPSSAAKGPARPETATVARQTVGTGTSGAAVTGLQDELQRRWNPNCNVEGGRDVQVRVTFVIGAGGQVVGNVASQIKSAQSPVSQAAADRAVRAVYAAAPFRDLPREFYGDKISVNFIAREACSG